MKDYAGRRVLVGDQRVIHRYRRCIADQRQDLRRGEGPIVDPHVINRALPGTNGGIRRVAADPGRNATTDCNRPRLVQAPDQDAIQIQLHGRAVVDACCMEPLILGQVARGGDQGRCLPSRLQPKPQAGV